MIQLTSLPLEIQRILGTATFSPDDELFYVTHNDRSLGVMDGRAGEHHFGEQVWRQIISGQNPEVRCEKITFTIH